jgi:hypothetical protein
VSESATTLPSYAVRPEVTIPDWSVVTSPVVKDALLAMFESEHIGSRWGGYAQAENRLRRALVELYAEHGRAPTVDTLAARTGLSETAVRPLLANLRQRDLVVLDAGGERIVGAYPFTDRDTEHRVRLDGRVVNAMCAVDALGVGAMLNCDAEIASRCRGCGAPIRITTRDRGRGLAEVEPQTAVAWLGLRYEGGCAANSLCTVTAFFCTDDHLEVWRREHPNEGGAACPQVKLLKPAVRSSVRA